MDKVQSCLNVNQVLPMTNKKKLIDYNIFVHKL